jgi:hypothetical protein
MNTLTPEDLHQCAKNSEELDVANKQAFQYYYYYILWSNQSLHLVCLTLTHAL